MTRFAYKAGKADNSSNHTGHLLRGRYNTPEGFRSPVTADSVLSVLYTMMSASADMSVLNERKKRLCTQHRWMPQEKGIITKEMERVAAKEQMDVQELCKLVAQGKIAIPANKLHTCLEPNGIGSMLKTKINVNLGTSRDWKDLDMELEKVNDAVKMGAESIMDLSSYGDTQKFRRKLTSECPAIIGTVPIYDAVVYYHKPLKEITSEEWIQIVEMHAKDGVDFMTIHVGINKSTAKRFKGK